MFYTKGKTNLNIVTLVANQLENHYLQLIPFLMKYRLFAFPLIKITVSLLQNFVNTNATKLLKIPIVITYGNTYKTYMLYTH